MIFVFVFLFLMFHVGVSFPYSEEYSKSYYTICTGKATFNLPHSNVKWNWHIPYSRRKKKYCQYMQNGYWDLVKAMGHKVDSWFLVNGHGPKSGHGVLGHKVAPRSILKESCFFVSQGQHCWTYPQLVEVSKCQRFLAVGPSRARSNRRKPVGVTISSAQTAHLILTTLINYISVLFLYLPLSPSTCLRIPLFIYSHKWDRTKSIRNKDVKPVCSQSR